MRVVLVRPWTDAHSGGCCGGDVGGGVCVERSGDRAHEHDPDTRVLGEVYQRLRTQLPDVDVQIVDAGNTIYLLPTTFRSVRRRRGFWTAVREAGRSTTAGAVLVDGERVGDVGDLGVEGVLAEVRRRLAEPTRHPST